MENTVGFAHYWAQGDAVSHTVAYALLLMSLASWYFILSKGWSAWRMRRSSNALDGFWKAPTLDDAIATMQHIDSERIEIPLALQASEAASISSNQQNTPSLNASTDPGELITLESPLLASVGSTAPFDGLFGTVWGIYHALAAVSASGTVQIDKVAGPVGEALIMTALGLAVAIPAVLAYNTFTRINRVALAELDGFAHDLHAYLTTGERVDKGQR